MSDMLAACGRAWAALVAWVQPKEHRRAELDLARRVEHLEKALHRSEQEISRLRADLRDADARISRATQGGPDAARRDAVRRREVAVMVELLRDMEAAS